MSDIYLPFPRDLYDDVVRISNGNIDLVTFSIAQFHSYVRRTAHENAHGIFGDRLREFLEIYHPDIDPNVRAETEDESHGAPQRTHPMIWKEVVIAPGTRVRMQYSGGYQLGNVFGGKIKDKDGEFTPSEWASKVAGGTNRNAWRDLWFCAPGKSNWVRASTLRDKAINESKKLHRLELAHSIDIPDDGTDWDALVSQAESYNHAYNTPQETHHEEN